MIGMTGTAAFKLLIEYFPEFDIPVPGNLRLNETYDFRLKATGLERIQREQANKPVVLPVRMTVVASIHGPFIVKTAKFQVVAPGTDGREFDKWVSTDTKNVVQPIRSALETAA